MRTVALVFWALSLVTLLMQFALTPSSVTTSDNGGEATTVALGFFESMTLVGAMSYGAIFAFFVAGCVFWVGHLVKPRPN